jgi:hypothetical protein
MVSGWLKCKDEQLRELHGQIENGIYTNNFVDNFPYFQFNKNLTSQRYFDATLSDLFFALLQA